MKTKYLPVKFAHKVEGLPSFHKSGSILGMKRLYYGMNAMLVRCGDYIYNCSSKPEIYQFLAK